MDSLCIGLGPDNAVVMSADVSHTCCLVVV